MSKPAIGYVRVSTEEQARAGISLDAQTERIRAYCAMSGLDLVEIIRDEGVSGAKPIGKRWSVRNEGALEVQRKWS